MRTAELTLTLAHFPLDRARALITTLPDDAQNLYVVLAAKERRPDLLTISRASNANAVSKLKVAGAQNVIMPDQVGGAHMASLVAIPDVVEFLDHSRIHDEGREHWCCIARAFRLHPRRVAK